MKFLDGSTTLKLPTTHLPRKKSLLIVPDACEQYGVAGANDYLSKLLKLQ
ncbi:MAG: hypothetical protein ACM37W_00130 [Actinomycetota bacterium]